MLKRKKKEKKGSYSGKTETVHRYWSVLKYFIPLTKPKWPPIRDKDPLHLKIFQFVHFMVKILFHKSNDI